MSPPASERADPITPQVHVTHTLRPSNGVRTAQRALPTTALNTYPSWGEGGRRPGEGLRFIVSMPARNRKEAHLERNSGHLTPRVGRGQSGNRSEPKKPPSPRPSPPLRAGT